jgi:hypothetical protein
MAKKDQNPDQIVHAHVKPGETVVVNDHAYGDRATLQVPRHVAKDLAVDEVHRADVPDVAKV